MNYESINPQENSSKPVVDSIPSNDQVTSDTIGNEKPRLEDYPNGETGYDNVKPSEHHAKIEGKEIPMFPKIDEEQRKEELDELRKTNRRIAFFESEESFAIQAKSIAEKIHELGYEKSIAGLIESFGEDALSLLGIRSPAFLFRLVDYFGGDPESTEFENIINRIFGWENSSINQKNDEYFSALMKDLSLADIQNKYPSLFQLFIERQNQVETDYSVRKIMNWASGYYLNRKGDTSEVELILKDYGRKLPESAIDRAIEMDVPMLLLDYPDMFEGLNLAEQIAELIAGIDESYSGINDIHGPEHKFFKKVEDLLKSDLSIQSEVAKLMIIAGYGERILEDYKYYDVFGSMDESVALLLVEKGYGEMVAEKYYRFPSLKALPKPPKTLGSALKGSSWHFRSEKLEETQAITSSLLISKERKMQVLDDIDRIVREFTDISNSGGVNLYQSHQIFELDSETGRDDSGGVEQLKLVDERLVYPFKKLIIEPSFKDAKEPEDEAVIAICFDYPEKFKKDAPSNDDSADEDVLGPFAYMYKWSEMKGYCSQYLETIKELQKDYSLYPEQRRVQLIQSIDKRRQAIHDAAAEELMSDSTPVRSSNGVKPKVMSFELSKEAARKLFEACFVEWANSSKDFLYYSYLELESVSEEEVNQVLSGINIQAKIHIITSDWHNVEMYEDGEPCDESYLELIGENASVKAKEAYLAIGKLIKSKEG